MRARFPLPTTDALLDCGSRWRPGGAVRQALTRAGPEEALQQRRASAEGSLCPTPGAARWGHATAPVGSLGCKHRLPAASHGSFGLTVQG